YKKYILYFFMLEYMCIIFNERKSGDISMLGQQEQSGTSRDRLTKGINFNKSNTLFNIVSDHQRDNHRNYA
ncbi:hypothetical protein, partial [Spiroplasma sp. hyd1]|uniref:hypothetical protein n=1 Tax=Spiroplasma sp. hyd1 TaxID=1609976 RepID=UPI001E45F367